MTDWQTAALAELRGRPCRCIRCSECNGTGRVSYGCGKFSHDEDTDRCDCGDGLSEVCERCMEIADIEADLL